ncbi:MAG: SpoIID/LytB domain-containing protein [Flavobacteriia bacterium]|nr:SpoIID/LytB domain-containing protein [Flavobacteriia bacterium]
MGKYRIGLIVFILQFYSLCGAQVVRIGLFPTKKFTRIKFTDLNSEYLVIGDTTFIGSLSASNSCEVLQSSNGKIDVFYQGERLLGFTQIRLIASKKEHALEISSSSPSLKNKAFEGDFEVKSVEGHLLVVNAVDVETYLEGVLESEGGEGRSKEYYKVQAVISRTFALKSKDKHAAEGFHLCNQVHCQAYLHKRLGSAVVDSAVKATNGQVLLDSLGQLAPTFFSANCGGQTSIPSFVWNVDIPTLKSIVDTFCTKTKQAKWTATVDPTDWKTFFVQKYAYPIDDSLSYTLLFNTKTDNRKAFFIHPGYGIPMKDIREKFDLKSSFFSVGLSEGKVILTGRGYGHGVGLCQEGAMTMSKKGYDFQQVLGYYYPEYRLAVIP